MNPRFIPPEEDDIEALKLQNNKLKTDLEREQHLHSLLYKEWEQLKDQIKGGGNDARFGYRNTNSFYKYGFYSLLILLVPAFFIFYFRSDSNDTVADSQTITDSARPQMATPRTTAGTVNDSLPRSQPKAVETQSQPAPVVTPSQPEPKKQIVVEQPPAPREEKAVTQKKEDKPPAATVSKPEPEQPLTDELREAISSDGFNAYFEGRRRNPYKKSSERYKIWQDGYNDGKLGAQQVEAKDSK